MDNDPHGAKLDGAAEEYVCRKRLGDLVAMNLVESGV